MKKLIPALCMLLVAAALLGTSTYAWFSMNDTVTATGMQVKATTAASLTISDASDGTYDDSITLEHTDSTTALKPATVTATVEGDKTSIGTTTGSNPTVTDIAFYNLGVNQGVVNAYGQAATKTMAEVLADDALTFGDWFVESDSTDYVTDSMWLKYAGEAATKIDLGIEITYTGTAVDIYKALHVAFVVNGKWYNYDVSTFDHDTSEKKITKTIEDFAGADINNTATQVDLYVWYEGEDTDCYTNNALTTQALTINLNFTVASNS